MITERKRQPSAVEAFQRPNRPVARPLRPWHREGGREEPWRRPVADGSGGPRVARTGARPLRFALQPWLFALRPLLFGPGSSAPAPAPASRSSVFAAVIAPCAGGVWRAPP